MFTDEKDDYDKMLEQLKMLERLEDVERAVLKFHKNTQQLNADLKKCGLSQVAFLLENGFLDFSFRLTFLQSLILQSTEALRPKSEEPFKCQHCTKRHN